MVTAINLNLTAIASSQNLSPESSKAAAETVSFGEQLSREIGTMSYLLHPPLLDEAGLQAALQWYVSGFGERSRTDVSLQLPPEMPCLAADLESSIFRVWQESLARIYPHAGG